MKHRYKCLRINLKYTECKKTKNYYKNNTNFKI